MSRNAERSRYPLLRACERARTFSTCVILVHNLTQLQCWPLPTNIVNAHAPCENSWFIWFLCCLQCRRIRSSHIRTGENLPPEVVWKCYVNVDGLDNMEEIKCKLVKHSAQRAPSLNHLWSWFLYCFIMEFGIFLFNLCSAVKVSRSLSLNPTFGVITIHFPSAANSLVRAHN